MSGNYSNPNGYQMKKTFLLPVLLLLLLTDVASAQSHEKILSVFIYNFAINGEWANKEDAQEFIIGIVGNGADSKAIAEELHQLAAMKTIGKRKIAVAEFARESDVKDCHILFIPESKSSMLSPLTTRLSSTSTLIITEKAGLAKLGSAINFINVEGKLRYEVNMREIDRRNIKISSRITSLGLSI